MGILLIIGFCLGEKGVHFGEITFTICCRVYRAISTLFVSRKIRDGSALVANGFSCGRCIDAMADEVAA